MNEFLSSHSIVSMCCKCYKKKLLNLSKLDFDGDDINNGEDTLQSAEIYSNVQSFWYIDKQLYNYRIGSGMTTKFDGAYFDSFKNILHIINTYKEKWNLNEFDDLMGLKYFNSTGRAITQLQYMSRFEKKEVVKYLIHIRESESFVFYIMRYKKIASKLKKRYRILIDLLISKQYVFIYILIKMKRKNY